MILEGAATFFFRRKSWF